jgi:hypothetical protein
VVIWYRRLCPNSSQRSRVRCNAKRIAWMKHKCKVRELGQPQAVVLKCSVDGTRAQRSGRPQDGARGSERRQWELMTAVTIVTCSGLLSSPRALLS